MMMVFPNVEKSWLASSVVISILSVFAFVLIFAFLSFVVISQINRQFMVMEWNQVQHLMSILCTS